MTNFWQKLNKPFTVLAPMDDVTDNVFRQIVNKTARPDVFFTEFTNSDGLNSVGNKIVGRKLEYTDDQHPIVAQIWGEKPESIENASRIILEKDFDGIDINMGCPVREVIKKGAGAGLIGNYNLAEEIIASAKRGVNNKISVSVKTRLGLNTNIAEEWATFLLKQDINALTIHARTAKQMSKGDADWDEIAKIVEIKNRISPNTLIIGNGDVKSYQEVLEKHKKYKVDGVMIGRGIFQNPWVFDFNSPVKVKSDYVNLLLKHLELFDKTWGENKPSTTFKVGHKNNDRNAVVLGKNFAVMKKFFKMYINNFPHASELRVKLMECKDYKEAKTILQESIKQSE